MQLSCISGSYMNFKKITLIAFILIAIPLLLTSAAVFLQGSDSSNSENNSKQTKVIASILPVYSIANEIEGDLFVELLADGQVDAHDFEPSTGDIKKVLESDVFVYLGGIDSWAEEIAEEAKNNGVEVLELSEFAVTTLDLDNKESHSDDHEEDDHSNEEDNHDNKEEAKDEEANKEHSDDHEGGFDPHFWLDPENAKVFAAKISETIEGSSLDTNKFEQLDNQYSQALTNCNQNFAVVSHNAFSYLGNKYNFEIISIAGLEPSDEPSPAELSEIINRINDLKINYLLVEEKIGEDFANSIATETNVQILLLTPFESGSKDTSYFEYMRQNLESLKAALECS